MSTIDEIKDKLRADGDIAAAIRSCSELIVAHPNDDEYLVERGLLYWKLGNRADAINDYNEAIRINPSSRAVQVKEATYSILDYYNKDLYNP